LLPRVSVYTALLLVLHLTAGRAEVVVTTAVLNLRQEPSTASPRIRLLAVSEELELIERRGLWVRVRFEEQEGWVHSDYVVGSEPSEAALLGDDLARAARDARLARDVALLRVTELERELESARSGDGGRQLVVPVEPLGSASEPAEEPEAAREKKLIAVALPLEATETAE